MRTDARRAVHQLTFWAFPSGRSSPRAFGHRNHGRRRRPETPGCFNPTEHARLRRPFRGACGGRRWNSGRLPHKTLTRRRNKAPGCVERPTRSEGRTGRSGRRYPVLTELPRRTPPPPTLILFKTLRPRDAIGGVCPGLARRPRQVLRFRLWPHLSTYLGPAPRAGLFLPPQDFKK